jgi:hypothetical protein
LTSVDVELGGASTTYQSREIESPSGRSPWQRPVQQP